MTEKANYILPCPIEEFYKGDGWVVVRDGQQPSNNGVKQFTSSPEEIRYFTRILRKMENGKFVDKWVKFVYDLRTFYCVDVKESAKEPNGRIRRCPTLRWEREDVIEAGN